MFVNIRENKWQILISSTIAFCFYYFTKSLEYSFIIVLILSILLRKINIDKIVNNHIGN